jgi:uncharacterized repeat protein (TIGR03987 family)
MKPILIAGTSIVTLALISYTLFIFSERKTKRAGNKVLLFLTIGVIFDITATICMVIGSSKSPFTLHGILGYSSLLGMVTDAFFTWRSRFENGKDSPLSVSLHKYTLISYCWWIFAYITGFLLVMLR